MNNRLHSLDVFRGATIFAMILVNDLASVRSIPPWLKHAPEGTDAMTVVDVVFPAFLFIIGMAIPLALGRRLRASDHSLRPVLTHVAIRTLSLLVLGVFMVNISFLDSAGTGMNRELWTALFFIAALLVWSTMPAAVASHRWLVFALRALGLVSLALLAYMYRGNDGGVEVWMQTRWWGILGLIGWTYCAVSVQFVVFRRNLPAHLGMLALYIALYIGDRTGVLSFLGPLNDVLWVGGHVGGHASITTAGVCLSLMFLGEAKDGGFGARQRWLGLFVLMLCAAGFLLRPLYGISKIMATPAWSLLSAASSIMVFGILYTIVDVYGKGRMFRFLEPAGGNPLLAYLLPLVLYPGIAIVAGTLWETTLGEGALGIIRSFAFALVVIWITGAFSRIGLHLRL